jgi:hypothetical protein
MLLSRFWYVLLGLLLGGAVFSLYLAQSMYNRQGSRAMGEGLSADSQVVAWYLRDDARMRSGHLVKFALDADIAKGLSGASKSETKLDEKYRAQVGNALAKVNQSIPKDEAFDAVFAVDQHGRAVGYIGYPQASGLEDFELGGYPVVADALHGFIRDDTLVLGRIYRVVARPVELEAGSAPAGAILGARIVDDRFARELSSRTNAAVAFYVGGARVAAGAPEGFPKANLDQIVSDIEKLESDDKDYAEKGRSGVRVLEGAAPMAVQYTRLQGEAYVLGAGYVVGRMAGSVSSPFGFFGAADDKDKESVNKLVVGSILLAAILVGLILSLLEHTLPLRTFEKETFRLAKGEVDQLQPSRFRGIYRSIAAEMNEGIDKAAASQGGVSRRAADLGQVLGDLPQQPMMAAFSLPGADAGGLGAAPAAASSQQRAPMPAPLPVAGRSMENMALAEQAGAPSPNRPAPPRRGAAAGDAEAEWRQVYEQFVALKQHCGEVTEGFTYEKFRATLIKNRDALVARHGAVEVKFSVYVKDGKAALKASPAR